MTVHFGALIICAIVAMALGFAWYGFLFRKTWASLTGAVSLSKAEMKAMNKKMMPAYGLQFALVLLQTLLLSYLTGPSIAMSIASALLVWLGFVMPTIASICMWNNEPRKQAWKRFGVQAGFQLVSLLVFGIILGLAAL